MSEMSSDAGGMGESSDAPPKKGFNEQQLRFMKVVVRLTWLLATAAFFFPLYDSGVGPFLRFLFWILAATHFVEFLVYLKLYRTTGESMARHFLGTMVFGIIHYTEVKQRHGID